MLKDRSMKRRDFMKWMAGSAVFAPGASLLQAANPASPSAIPDLRGYGSDVGSLLPLIEGQARKGDFPLSFLRPQVRSHSAWRRRARARLLDLLHYSPPPCDPRPEVVQREDCGDYFQEKVFFNTTPDVRVPAFVLIPKRGKFPAPAIVALHDHGAFYLWGKEKLVENRSEHPSLTQFKRQLYEGKSTASELARQGYVVVVIDMFYWGDRRMLLEKDAADWRERTPGITPERVLAFNQRASTSEPVVGRSIYAAGFTWPGVIFWDDIRTVDYLVTRPEVDRHRIGCVGLSVGGFRSCHLAALDDRIKCAVVVGWMTSFPYQLKRKVLHTIGHSMIVPGLYRDLDYPDVAAMAAPAALMVINGTQDKLFDAEGVRVSHEKLAACYKKAGVGEKLCLRMYDTPHEFNIAMQKEAWAWLKHWV
jgi:dienelactone hydrolase